MRGAGGSRDDGPPSASHDTREVLGRAEVAGCASGEAAINGSGSHAQGGRGSR